MDHFYRHDVMDLQSMESVSKSLHEGIVSICNICKSLMNAQVDPTTDTCSNYKEIRRHIEDAEQSMKNTEKMIQDKLVHLDERMEQLIREKQNIEQQKKEKNMTMEKLHEEKRSAEVSLEYSKEALSQAVKNLKSANYALSVQQDRVKTGEGLTIAGGVLLAIPIIGWIAGPIMITEGQRGIEEASNALRHAESEKQNCESQLWNWVTKALHYEVVISETQAETEQANEALKRIEWKIEEVQEHLKDTAEIQEVVRRSVNLLSVLSGRVTVLEKQTQRFFLWKPVVKSMEDVMKAMVNIAENRLLYSDGVPGLINTLRENVGGLLALCNSSSNSENDSYY